MGIEAMSDVQMQTTNPSPIRAPMVELVPIEALRCSTTSVQAERRKRFSESALAELAATIAKVGVIEPIVVRVIERSPSTVYEIVSGERRYRGAQLAKIEKLPALVRELSNEEVLAIQLIENLQREELHGLDEAEAFERLLERPGCTVQSLSVEVGKSTAYIQQRRKLLALCPAARRAFSDGKLKLPIAFLLARIPSAELQREALKEVGTERCGEPMSFREALRHIEHRYMLRLSEAPFPTQDETLLPAAGPCGRCPKRTGNQPELFADVKGADVCTDPTCFAQKRKLWGARQIAAAREAGRDILDGAAAKRIAPSGAHYLQGYVRPTDHCNEDRKYRTYQALLGDKLKPSLLVVPGTDEVIEVVERTAIVPLLKARGISATSRQSSAAEREKRAKAKLETAFRWKLFEAVRAKSPEVLSRTDLELVAYRAFNGLGYESRKRVLRAWKWFGKDGKEVDSCRHDEAARTRVPKLSDAELSRFLLDCVLVSDLYVSPWVKDDSPTRLLAAAKKVRVDAEAIRKTVYAGVAGPKQPALSPPKKSAARAFAKRPKSAAA
jgi:ParB/RepB/Spo0J family partition protein